VKPRVGITVFNDSRETGTFTTLNNTYVRSVAAAGGLPLLLPVVSEESDIEACAEAYVDSLDGLMFSGGADLSPHLFGEAPLPCVARISESRDSWELALFRAARKRGLPILGICRGCQVINVALGGTLYQDIPSQVPGAHGHYPQGQAMDELYHDVEIADSGSRLAKALGSGRLRTNSFHHQAVRDLGKDLVQTARSADGVIEGYEGTDPERFLVAVQFHPEALTARHPRFLSLFQALTEAARAYAG